MKSIKSENFEKTIKNGITVVKWWSEFCLQCSALDPTMKKLEDKYTNIKFYSMHVNDSGDIPTSYGIISLPTVILFKDGEPIHQFYGNLPHSEYEKEFDKI